ncbi:diguanylate cyclase [Candidatus Omnitrophota bacterium]
MTAEHQAPKKRVEQLVFRDELTNVFNRRYLYQYLPQELSRAKGSGSDIWFFMIDIDDFKLVNDKYGHLAGDQVLKGVAEVLSQCVRSEDIVVRYAGDEFTIVLPGGTLSESLTIAKKISKNVSEHRFNFEGSHTSIRVNLSIGIAHFPDDAQDSLRLIDLADKALYSSKQKGKNRISLVSDISIETLREKEISQRFPCVKIVERTSQLEQLKAIFKSAQQENKFALTVIEGETGVGKSRLLNECFTMLSSKEALCKFVSCAEKHIEQSYRYILISLNAFLEELKNDKNELLRDVEDEKQSILASIIPFFQNQLGIQPAALKDFPKEKLEQQVFEGLLQLLKNIAAIIPFCIFFDDFHLVDEKTLKLIIALHEQECRAIFYVAFEKSDLYSSEEIKYPLATAYNTFSDCIVTDIRLQPLSLESTSEMIATILDNLEPSREFDELIFRITRGNPLFIEEILKFLIQKGFLYAQKGKWQKVDINEKEIPTTLQEVIQLRIKNLDKSAQELIAKAAVIGQDFDVDLLHRLGKKDEGYVLDILESAKRAGIIKEKITPYGEEMSFVSDEIRRVLFNLVEQDEMKGLHQQLGQIKEGLHSNKLDHIASELYYHFKKAEDYHRATEYAQRIKEADGLVYDRAIQYAKEILSEEAEEKKLVPLNKKSLEILPDIIRLLYIVNVNYVLYPSDSAMIQSPIEQIYENLTQIFTWDEFLIFSEVKGILVINGERVKGVSIKKLFENAFIDLLRAHHLESLTFKRGLTIQELAVFLELIGKSTEEEILSESLKTKEISNIEVREISYDAVSRHKKTDERAKLEDVMLMDFLLGKLQGVGEKNADVFSKLDTHSAEIAEAITKMGEMIAEGKGVEFSEGQKTSATKSKSTGEKKTEDLKHKEVISSKKPVGKTEKKSKATVAQHQEKKEFVQAEVVSKSLQKLGNQIWEQKPLDWEKYKKGLAKTILNLEPKLQKDVLLASHKSPFEGKKDIIKELIPEFPDEVIVDLLVNEFQKTDSSIVNMRRLTQKFLIDPVQKERLIPLIKNKLLRQGVQKTDLPWIFSEKKWNDFSLEERIAKFMHLSVKDYLDLENEININSLILELISESRMESLKKILGKWKEFLRAHASADEHQRLIKSFSRIIDLIPSARADFIGNLSDFLFEEFRHEKDIDIYSHIVDYLSKSCEKLIENKNFVASVNIVKKLKKESLYEKLSDAHKRLIVDSLGNILQTKKIKIIIDELVKRIDNNIYYNDIAEFIVATEEPEIIKLLIEQAMIDERILSSLGYFGAFLRKRTVGEILLKYIEKQGKDVVMKKLQEKIKDSRVFVVKDTIEIITHLKDPSMASYLEPLLKHQDDGVRKKMTFALGKMDSLESGKVLTKALLDKDNDVLVSAIRALGNVGDSSIVELLKPYESRKDTAAAASEAIKNIERRKKQVRL